MRENYDKTLPKENKASKVIKTIYEANREKAGHEVGGLEDWLVQLKQGEDGSEYAGYEDLCCWEGEYEDQESDWTSWNRWNDYQCYDRRFVRSGVANIVGGDNFGEYAGYFFDTYGADLFDN